MMEKKVIKATNNGQYQFEVTVRNYLGMRENYALCSDGGCFNTLNCSCEDGYYVIRNIQIPSDCRWYLLEAGTYSRSNEVWLNVTYSDGTGIAYTHHFDEDDRWETPVSDLAYSIIENRLKPMSLDEDMDEFVNWLNDGFMESDPRGFDLDTQNDADLDDDEDELDTPEVYDFEDYDDDDPDTIAG